MRRLDEWNGRRWFPRLVAVEAGSGGSGTGFGGTIRILGRPQLTIVGALSEAEREMSSTAPAMTAFYRVLWEAHKRAGDAFQGAALLLNGDNQSAVRAVNAFRSRATDVNAALQQLFEMCVEGDFDVVAQWKPRAEMQEEDDFSKLRDSSDWGMRHEDLRRVLHEFEVEPALDLFALDMCGTSPGDS